MEWPAYGSMNFRGDCKELLLVSLSYKQSKQPNPELDYVPIKITIEEISGRVKREAFFLPVFIKGPFHNLAPKLHWKKDEVILQSSSSFLLDHHLLTVRDPDDEDDRLLVIELVDAGDRVITFLHADGQHVTCFTAEQLKRGRISIRAPSVRYDKVVELKAKATDRWLSSSKIGTIRIRIDASPFQRLDTWVDGALFVERFGNVIIKNLNVISTHENVKIRAKVLPTLGRLSIHRGISLEDLKKGRVNYRHQSSSKKYHDQIIFTITSDQIEKQVTLSIRIISLKFPQIRIITTNKFIKVIGETRLTNHSFITNEKDGDNVIYRIVQQPLCGRIVRKTRDYQTGKMIVSDFSQFDIRLGRIFYRPKTNGNCHKRDLMIVKARNWWWKGKWSVEKTIRFKVKVKKLSPTDLIKVHAGAPDSLEIPETHMALLSSLFAYYKSSNVHFRIVKQPYFSGSNSTNDAGMVILNYGPDNPSSRWEGNFSLAKEFTRENVKKNQIIYIPPLKDIGQRKRIVTFAYQPFIGNHNGIIRIIQITVLPVNNKAPEVTPLKLSVFSSSKKTLKLNIHDCDTPDFKVNVRLKTLPQAGFIKLHSDTLTVGQSFTIADIKRDPLLYVHDNRSLSTRDQFSIEVDDGRHMINSSIYIDIRPQSYGVVKSYAKAIHVNERGYVKISPLNVFKRGSPVNYKLIRQPKYGILNSSFQEKDLLIGKVSYHHVSGEIGADNLYDNCLLEAQWGKIIRHIRLIFTIIPVDKKSPRIKHPNPLLVDENGDYYITDHELTVHDPDSLLDYVNFAIIRQPRFGILLKKNLTQILWNFSLKDIYDRRIIYRTTKESKEKQDSIELYATDGKNYSPPTTIKIMKKRDRKIMADSFKQKFTNSFSLKKSTLKVLERGETTLNEFHLDILCSREISEADIKYTITEPPLLGILHYITDRGRSVTSFTQADINAQKLAYSHHSKTDSELDNFSFSVRISNNKVIEDYLLIKISVIDVQLPTVKVFVPLTVGQGEIMKISKKNLFTTDPDTDSKQITYKIISPPLNGQILVGNDTVKDNFSQFAIDNGDVYYRSDGSDNSIDFFLLHPSDSHNAGYLRNKTVMKTPLFFTVLIQPPTIHAPVVRNKIPDKLEYFHKNKKYGFLISNSYLKASEKDVLFTIKTIPKQGCLYDLKLMNKISSNFTQAQINNNQVAFFLNKNTSKTEDYFNFTVLYGHRHTLPNNQFKLKWSIVIFSKTKHIICEDAGHYDIIIQRMGKINLEAQIRIKVKEITATALSDFIPVSQSIVRFAPKQTLAKWTIRTVLDKENEKNERFELELIDGKNVVVGFRKKATIEIVNFRRKKCDEYIGMVTSSSKYENEAIRRTARSRYKKRHKKIKRRKERRRAVNLIFVLLHFLFNFQIYRAAGETL